MADKNFIVKNGLEVGGQEVVSSSGVVTSAALGGQTLASTDSPTFNNLTLTNDIAVGGDINLTGDLNITGDVNSVSVTDLDVTDQTITLGKGQVESASGGSGIVIDGSGASILWDETNDEWDLNKNVRAESFSVGAGPTAELLFLSGAGHNGHGTTNTRSVASFNQTGQSAGLWFGARNDETTGIIGTRTATGNLAFETYNSGWGERMRITYDGKVGIGTSSPARPLDVNGAIRVGNASAVEWGGTNEAIVGDTGGALIYKVGGSEIMRNTSTGLGIGTTANANLHIGSAAATGDATNPALQIGGATTYRLGMYTTAEGGVIDNANGDNGLQFHTKNVGEAVRITANGNLQMIGQTSSFESPGLTYHTNNYLYLRGGSSGLILADDSGINTVQIIDGSAGYINFETGDGTGRMRIMSHGGVAIGTNNTGYSGQILSVKSGTGDYVLYGESSDANCGISLRDNSSTQNIVYGAEGNNHVFKKDSTEYMRITDGGDVSIGSDHSGFSGWRVLNLRGEAGAGALVNWESNNATRKAAIAQSSSDLRLQVFDTGSITFEPGTGTEYMRLDASGHLILGSNISTTEAGKLSVYTDATNDPAIYGYRSTSSFKIVPFLSNGAFSSLSGVNDSGLFFSDNFVIAKHATGNYGMKILGTGKILIGTGSAVRGSERLSLDCPDNEDAIVVQTPSAGLIVRKDSFTNGFLCLFENSSGSAVGSITSNGSTTSYSTSSDYRIKENIVNLDNALDRVAQLQPKRFNFISDADTTVDGFIAHEVSDIVPEAVSGEKDATREEEYEVTPAQYEDDGETLISEAVMETRTVPVYQGIDQSKLVPLLTKAIQEQQTIIDDLKSRLDEAGL